MALSSAQYDKPLSFEQYNDLLNQPGHGLGGNPDENQLTGSQGLLPAGPQGFRLGQGRGAAKRFNAMQTAQQNMPARPRPTFDLSGFGGAPGGGDLARMFGGAPAGGGITGVPQGGRGLQGLISGGITGDPRPGGGITGVPQGGGAGAFGRDVQARAGLAGAPGGDLASMFGGAGSGGSVSGVPSAPGVPRPGGGGVPAGGSITGVPQGGRTGRFDLGGFRGGPGPGVGSLDGGAGVSGAAVGGPAGGWGPPRPAGAQALSPTMTGGPQGGITGVPQGGGGLGASVGGLQGLLSRYNTAQARGR